MKIDRYEEVVNRLAADKTDSRFSNKGPDHATIVVNALFRNATSTVRLFTGCLYENFYTSDIVASAVQKFLENSTVRLSILSENPLSARGMEWVQSLAGGDRVSVFILDKTKIAKDAKIPNHFMVADNQAFRLEIDDAKREAVVNFNEPTLAIALSNLFDTLVERCSSKLPLPSEQVTVQ